MSDLGPKNNSHITAQSFRQSALRYLDRLYSYAVTLTRNRDEAEDLVQETYLRAMNAFERLRPDSALESWLFTILRNIRLNQVRDGLNKSRTVEMCEPAMRRCELENKSLKDPLSLYLTEVKQADVRKAIENLPEVYREIIVLRESEELSYEEIARLGLSIGHCNVSAEQGEGAAQNDAAAIEFCDRCSGKPGKRAIGRS